MHQVLLAMALSLAPVNDAAAILHNHYLAPGLYRGSAYPGSRDFFCRSGVWWAEGARAPLTGRVSFEAETFCAYPSHPLYADKVCRRLLRDPRGALWVELPDRTRVRAVVTRPTETSCP